MSSRPPSVGISISASSDSIALGFDDRIINRLTIRIAEFFLFKGFRVVFGHDWREDGVMRAVAQLAETAASGGRLADLGAAELRMLNLVPTKGSHVSQTALRAQSDAEQLLRVESIREYIGKALHLPPDWAKDSICELWVLRDALTRELNPGIRICLGGRTSGYSGCYAGIAEEAFFALQQHKPLYLIGGFGGATADTANALRNIDFNTASLSPPKGFEPTLAQKMTAEALGLPMDGLAPTLAEYSMGRLSQNNRLSPDENRALFEMSDLESALAMIWQGAKRALEIAP